MLRIVVLCSVLLSAMTIIRLLYHSIDLFLFVMKCRECRGPGSRDIDKEAFKKLRAFERYEEEREEGDDDDDDDDVVEEEKIEDEVEGKDKDVISSSATTNHAHAYLGTTPATEWKVVSDIPQIRKIVEYLGEGVQDRDLSKSLVHSFLMERKADKDKDKDKDDDKDKEVFDGNDSNSCEEEKERERDKDKDVRETSDASGPPDEGYQQRPGRKVGRNYVYCLTMFFKFIHIPRYATLFAF